MARPSRTGRGKTYSGTRWTDYLSPLSPLVAVGRRIFGEPKTATPEPTPGAAMGGMNPNQNLPAGTTPVGMIGQPPAPDAWKDTPAHQLLFQQYLPSQQQLINQVGPMALQGLQQNPLNFGPIAANARMNFQQQTLPSILERFNALGGERSSAFPQILGSAASGLESDLAAQGAQYNLAQQELLQRLLGIGLTPQFNSLFNPGEKGMTSKLFENAPSYIAKALGFGG